MSLLTLGRSIEVLNCFSEEKPSWGVRELSNELNFGHSVIQRILSTFVNHGILMKNEETNKYEMGFKILEYYSVLQAKMQNLDNFTPIMKTISEKTNKTVFLNVLQGNEVVCLKIVESKQELRLVIKVGSKHPLYYGSRGKVMLAFLPREEQRRVLAPLDEAEQERISKQLEEIRQKGWSMTFGERVTTVVGISIPLFNRQNGVRASLTIGGPDERHHDPDEIEKDVKILKEHEQVFESLLLLNHFFQ